MNKLIVTLIVFFYQTILAQPVTNTGALAYYCPPCNSACDDKTFEKAGKCDHCAMELIAMTAQQRAKQMEQRKTIAFYLQDGVEVLDFAGPMEVFSYAGHEVFTVSKTKDPIRSQGILKIVPDYDINDAPKADILAFFGGNSNAASRDPKVIKWVKSQKDVDYHFSVCTGAFILAESGILDGKTATTFHDAINGLREGYPKAKVLDNVRFVDNGAVITTAGISAGIDGALHLVAKLQGLPEARLVAYYMEYDKWRPGEGLILSEDNPYNYEKLVPGELKEYEGTYEFDKGKTATVIAGTEGNTLYAVIESQLVPLYFKSKDEYVNTARKPITFLRDEGSIIGYKSNNIGPFKKLGNEVGDARQFVKDYLQVSKVD